VVEKARLVDPFFLLKLLLVPTLILTASLAGNRWGPAVSGWLVSLPLTSAPVVFFLAVEQGGTFASRASVGVILGLASITLFAFAYCWLALRHLEVGWPYPLLLGSGAFFFLTLLFVYVQAPAVLAFVGVVLFLFLAYRLLPRPPTSIESNTVVVWWEIILRMVAATALVLIITQVSSTLGPQLSGLLTPFPVYVSVLASSTYRLHGPGPAVQLVRGATLGLFTPATFFLIVSTTVVWLGIGPSFGLAIAASPLVHWLAFGLLKRGPSRMVRANLSSNGF
jgi:hypothetical protein